jgi:hypothetical protein
MPLRRAVRELLSFLRHEDSGMALVTIDKWTLAEELWSFGEDSLHLAPLHMSDEDMVGVWTLAGRLHLNGEARSAGEAAALAAVTVIEGKQRPLARKRRRPQAKRPQIDQGLEERLAEVYRIEDGEAFPPEWR